MHLHGAASPHGLGSWGHHLSTEDQRLGMQVAGCRSSVALPSLSMSSCQPSGIVDKEKQCSASWRCCVHPRSENAGIGSLVQTTLGITICHSGCSWSSAERSQQHGGGAHAMLPDEPHVVSFISCFHKFGGATPTKTDLEMQRAQA